MEIGVMRTRTKGIKAMGNRTTETKVMETRTMAVMAPADHQRTGLGYVTDAASRDILLGIARAPRQRQIDHRTTSGIMEVMHAVMVMHLMAIRMATSGMVPVVVVDEVVGGI